MNKFLKVLKQDKDTLTAEQLEARARKAALQLDAKLADAQAHVIDCESDVIAAIRQEPFNAEVVLAQMDSQADAETRVAKLEALKAEWFGA